MKYAVLFIALALCAGQGYGQSKTKPRPKTAKPAPTPTPQEARISIEAGLVYKSGDTKPLARTIFYLLDADLGQLLFDAGLTPPKNARPASTNTVQEQLVNSFGVASLNPYTDAEITAFYKKAKDLFAEHVLVKTTTGFDGKAEFEPTKPGIYYLVGVAETPRAFAIWNLKVTAKAGANAIILDQKNANYAE